MTEEGMPDCPRSCGGPRADLGRLPESALAVRERLGCDRDCAVPYYTITCPRCGGVGCDYKDCTGGVSRDGSLAMARCPTSQQGLWMAPALRAYFRMKNLGTLPVPGGTLDQSAAWLRFVDIFEEETAIAKREKDEAESKKARALNKRRGR